MIGEVVCRGWWCMVIILIDVDHFSLFKLVWITSLILMVPMNIQSFVSICVLQDFLFQFGSKRRIQPITSCHSNQM